MNSIKIKTDLNLKETFECGQCFRWNNTDGYYYGAAYGKELKLLQLKDGIELFCSQEDFESTWQSYFDLEFNYDSARKELGLISPVLEAASAYAPGIHILSQEPWEAICSFIISQNNNIPRIKGIIERLCALFGEQIGDDVYSFPNADVISSLSPEDLAPIRSGFRAKYIISAAGSIARGEIDLEEIKASPIEFGRAELQKIHGIGPKVAECSLLYGFHKTEGFPIDVWMKRAMEVLMPGFSPEDFGKNAGIAQQYLFHYSRMHPEWFK